VGSSDGQRRTVSSGSKGSGVVLALLFSLLPSVALAAPKPKDFKQGIQLQDVGAWRESIEKLDRAMTTAGDDDSQLVRIYGTRFQSYLPHYYKGLALYHLKDCQGALREWDRSLSTGAVRDTAEFDTLRLYQTDCQKRVPSQTRP